MAAVQVSLASYFVGIAFGQALYGPLSDRFGRKPALYLGLAHLHRRVAGLRVHDQRDAARRLPVSAGARRLRAARRAARRGPRLLRWARVGADAVDADPGDDAGADPGAVHRRTAAGAVRVAVGLPGARRLRARVARRWRRGCCPRACSPSNGGASRWRRSPRPTAAHPARSRVSRLGAVGRAHLLRGCWPTSRVRRSCTSSSFTCRRERFGLYFGANAIGLMIASQINRYLASRVHSEVIVRSVLPIARGGRADAVRRRLHRLRRLRRASWCRSSASSRATDSWDRIPRRWR